MLICCISYTIANTTYGGNTMVKNISAFGMKVEALQLEKGIDTVDLAKKIGIPHQNISQLKRSKHPRFSTIRKLVDVFEVGSDYFSPYI